MSTPAIVEFINETSTIKGFLDLTIDEITDYLAATRDKHADINLEDVKKDLIIASGACIKSLNMATATIQCEVDKNKRLQRLVESLSSRVVFLEATQAPPLAPQQVPTTRIARSGSMNTISKISPETSPRTLLSSGTVSRLKKAIEHTYEPPRRANVREHVVKWFKRLQTSKIDYRLKENDIHVIKPLANGSNSAIELVEYDGELVVLKTFNEETVVDTIVREFMNEVSSLMLLIGDGVGLNGIVTFIGAIATEQRLCIATKYYSNGNMHAFMRAQKISPENVKIAWATELARALEKLHALYIVHGDVKSYNLLLDDDEHLVLCDFGLAGAPCLSSLTYGTLRWLAPSVLISGATSFKSDIYSYGMVLWELCCNCEHASPFPDVSFDLQVENLIRAGCKPTFPESPVILRRLAENCLQTLPENRPTIQEVLVYLKLSQN